MVWLISTEDLIAQNIFMVWNQYVYLNSKENLYNELKKHDLPMFKNNGIISYSIQKGNIFAKIQECKISEIRIRFFWYNE